MADINLRLIIQRIADQIDYKEWRPVVDDLGLSFGEITDMTRQYMDDGPRKVIKKCFELWKRKLGNEAKLHHLIDSLLKAGSTRAASEAQKLQSEALIYACDVFSTNRKILSDLIQEGFDINVQLPSGSRPLHEAVTKSDYELAAYLLNHGANPMATDSDGVSPLQISFDKGELRLLRILLELKLLLDMSGIENVMKRPDIRDEHGETLLHIASQYALIGIIRENLAHGALVSAQGRNKFTALHYACYGGHREVVDLLLANGADVEGKTSDGATAIHVACEHGCKDVVKSLIEWGADVKARGSSSYTLLHYASQGGRLDVIDYLLDVVHVDIEATDTRSNTPLHLACQGGEVNVVKCLLRHHANVNARGNMGYSPLHVASEQSHVDIARVLLEAGANVESKDSNGERPLHVASRAGDGRVISCLLINKADINAKGQSLFTPMHYACRRQDNECLDAMIVEPTLDLDASDELGRTALHIACEYGNAHMVAQLLHRNANALAKTLEGKTPIEVAHNRGRVREIEAILKRHVKKDSKGVCDIQ